MRLFAAFLLFGLLVALCADGRAQAHRDPLNPREVEQLRASAQLPKKRIELLISFTRERMLAIDRLCRTTKGDATYDANQGDAIGGDTAKAHVIQLGPNETGKVADLLADVATLIDELDDNLTMYNEHSEDLRAPLRHVLEAEAEFVPKLKALNEGTTPLQKRQLGAALEDASDSLKTSSQSALAMLADQVEKKGEVKEKKKANRGNPDREPSRP